MSFEFKTLNENEVIVSVKTLSDMEKEIQSLKTQLKREMLTVAFYANKEKVNEMINGTGDDFEEIDGRYHGGKLARETVRARGIVSAVMR